MKKQGKISSPCRWRKRLCRIFLGAFLFLFLVIFIALVVFWRLYPSDKLGSFFSDRLTASLERPVHIETVSINPFGSVDIRNIRIDYLENETTSQKPFLQMEQLVFRFKLFSLLRRRLDITSVLFDRPTLFVIPDVLFELITEREEVEVEAEQKKEISLPFSLGLLHFVLDDLHFSMFFL